MVYASCEMFQFQQHSIVDCWVMMFADLYRNQQRARQQYNREEKLEKPATM